MLLELKVKNFAIIDSVHMSFKPGLNILSGETGAGKSVLLKSLALLMGEKALSDTVRTGSEQATIEGVFDLGHRKDLLFKLNEMGIDVSDDLMVVRRMISAQGKSRVFVNGSLSALGSLRDIVSPLIEVTGQSAPLIEMTGQHENKNLQSRAYHLDLLDHYTNSWALREQVETGVERLREVDREIDELKTQRMHREQRLDFLSFQRDEIRELDLKPGEEVSLVDNVKRQKNTSRLTEFAQVAEQALYSDDESALVRLHSVIQKAQELSSMDSSLLQKIEPLQQAKALIEDSVYELREYGRSIESDPEDLQSLEERLSRFRRLQKKYGETVEEILNSLAKIENEVETLEQSDERLEALENEKGELTAELHQVCDELHQRRVNGSTLLADGVNDELADLNMKGVQFVIQVEAMEDLASTGFSRVEFLIQSSKQDAPRPLAKYASGGELSRILLSLKRILGTSDTPRTYLFDEVDAGVSGQTAEKVGRKLKSIAKGQQVICVTHLPQVASFADEHFLIHKSPQQNGIHMEVKPMKLDERVKEIARLISGEKVTKTSMDHAKQLLQQAR